MLWGLCDERIPYAAIYLLHHVLDAGGLDIVSGYKAPCSVALEQEHAVISACCCVQDPYMD